MADDSLLDRGDESRSNWFYLPGPVEGDEDGDDDNASLRQELVEFGLNGSEFVVAMNASAGLASQQGVLSSIEQLAIDGKIAILAVRDIYDLGRDNRTTLLIRCMVKTGTRIIGLLNDFDTGRPGWELLLACYKYRATRGISVREIEFGGVQATKKYICTYGKPPFGFAPLAPQPDRPRALKHARFAVVPSQAILVTECFERKASGKSLAEIASWLSEQSDCQPPQNIEEMLSDEHYIGRWRLQSSKSLLAWRGDEIIKDEEEDEMDPVLTLVVAESLRIVDDALFYRVQNMLRSERGN